MTKKTYQIQLTDEQYDGLKALFRDAERLNIGERAHSIGERFYLYSPSSSFGAGECILAQTGNHLVSLISLQDGNRVRDGVKVNYPTRITDKEFGDIVGRFDWHKVSN